MSQTPDLTSDIVERDGKWWWDGTDWAEPYGPFESRDAALEDTHYWDE